MKRFYVKNNDLTEIDDWLETQKPGGRYFVEVKKLGTYTKEQQGYYWGVCIRAIAEHCGYIGYQGFNICGQDLIMDAEDYVHARIKAINHRATSTDCTVDEYAELIQTALALADWLGIEIPPPYTS